MSVVLRRAWTALAAVTVVAGAVGAQQPASETGPTVGETAPDFALGGATRYGILRDSITLSSYRGNTVVLAFFFKARTRG